MFDLVDETTPPRMRQSKPRGHSTNQREAEEEKELKKLNRTEQSKKRRLEKNRISAKQSRIRKKNY